MSDPGDIIPLSFGERLRDGLAGILIGLLMFLGSFALLAWNEGRALDAMALLARGEQMVVSVLPDRVDPANDGKLVRVGADATASRPLTDPATGVTAAGLIKLHRGVEMYQWTEHKNDRQIEYRREWASWAHNSDEFRSPDGHRNPPMPFRSATFVAPSAKLGAFTVDQKVLADAHPTTDWTPPAGTPVAGGFRIVDGGLYRGDSPAAPQVGDVRVSYEVVQNGPLTVVAGQSGDRLAVFSMGKDETLALARPGDYSAADMFRLARDEERLLTWILRGGGTVLMWIGLLLIFRPIAVVASVIPILGQILDAGIALAALIITLPLAALTIALAWIAVRPVLAVGLIVVAIGASYLVHRLRRGVKPPAVQTPVP